MIWTQPRGLPWNLGLQLDRCQYDGRAQAEHHHPSGETITLFPNRSLKVVKPRFAPVQTSIHPIEAVVHPDEAAANRLKLPRRCFPVFVQVL